MKIQVQINYTFSESSSVFKNVDIPKGTSIEDAEAIIENEKEKFLDTLGYEDAEGEAFFNISDLECVTSKENYGTDNGL